MPRKRAKKLTEDEKATFIESYRRGGVKPGMIATVLNKSPGQIHDFYSRWKLNSTLLPKGIVRNTNILGLQVKDLALNNPKLSSRRLARLLKDTVPNQPKYLLNNFRYPSYQTILRFLGENGFKRRMAIAVASHPNIRRFLLWTNTADPCYQVKMHSGGNSVMFWGSSSKYGTEKLVSLVKSMDSAKYIEVSEENLVGEFAYAKETYPGAWR